MNFVIRNIPEIFLLLMFSCVAILVVTYIPYVVDSEPKTQEQIDAEKGRAHRLHDTVSDSTLLKKVEKEWDSLGLNDKVDEIEELLDSGDTNYQPRKSRRIKQYGDEIRLERKFIESNGEYHIEATLYYVTRQARRSSVVTTKRYDHEIELAKVKFDVNVDKNEYGWKSNGINVSDIIE